MTGKYDDLPIDDVEPFAFEDGDDDALATVFVHCRLADQPKVIEALKAALAGFEEIDVVGED